MPNTQLRPTNQATSPTDLSEPPRVPLHNNPHVTQYNSSNILTPVAATKNQTDIMSFAGIATGVWGDTAQEVGRTLGQIKSGWELRR